MIYWLRYTKSFVYLNILILSCKEIILIISFASLKGGVAKTTSCANIAFALSQKKKKVLVVDFDAQGGVTHNLGSKFPTFHSSIYDVVLEKTDIENAIHEYSKTLHLIPIHYKFYEVASQNFEKILNKAIKKIRKKYDFIFFDLAPSIFPGTSVPLLMSDYVIIPVDCNGMLSILGLQKVEKIIVELMQKNKNTKLDLLGVLPTFVDKRTKVSRELIEFLQDKYEDKVLPEIRRNTAIAQSSSLGKSILEYKPKSNGAEDYQKLSLDILNRLKKKGKK